jgi:hypothetical protein
MVGGSIEQASDASVPWSKIVPDGSFLSTSAQDDYGTSITCEIIGVDGTSLSRHTSNWHIRDRLLRRWLTRGAGRVKAVPLPDEKVGRR